MVPITLHISKFEILIYRCWYFLLDIIIKRYFQRYIIPNFYTKYWNKAFDQLLSTHDYFDLLKYEAYEF